MCDTRTIMMDIISDMDKWQLKLFVQINNIGQRQMSAKFRCVNKKYWAKTAFKTIYLCKEIPLEKDKKLHCGEEKEDR